MMNTIMVLYGKNEDGDELFDNLNEVEAYHLFNELVSNANTCNYTAIRWYNDEGTYKMYVNFDSNRNIREEIKNW